MLKYIFPISINSVIYQVCYFKVCFIANVIKPRTHCKLQTFHLVLKINKDGLFYNSDIFFKGGGATKHGVKMSLKKLQKE